MTRVETVFLDALGTLIRLEPPAPRLRASLRSRLGLEISDDLASSAMRAEMRYYASHCVRARDDASLATLRLECADVLADTLQAGASGPELLPCLTDAIAFRLYDDVPDMLAALADTGVRLAVVSNWDVSLDDTLRRLGIAGRFAAVVHSAAVGASKPDPAIFQTALARLQVAAAAVLHVGDDERNDVQGARAVGIRALLLDRGRTAPANGVLSSLRDLPAAMAAAAAA